MKRLKISELARASATSASAIRYYESIGLLPAPVRAGSEQRRYDAHDVERVGFVRRCRALGFTLKEIAAFVQIARTRTAASGSPCRDIVQHRLAAVRVQLRRLKAVETRLAELLHEGAATPPRVSCERLAVLAWGPPARGSEPATARYGRP